MQCKGTTKEERRCRIDTRGGYCRYHVSQSKGAQPIQAEPSWKQQRPQKRPSQKKLPQIQSQVPRAHGKPPARSSSNGYIYVYTIHKGHRNVHIFNSKTQRFEAFSTKNPLVRALTRVFSRKPQMVLVKVGFTTKLPRERMHEWQQQCGHQLECVVPKGAAPHYDRQLAGWPCLQAHQKEIRIHAMLRNEYGRGKMHCGGCKKDALGVHVEWFLVPKSQLANVFALIDSVVVGGP